MSKPILIVRCPWLEDFNMAEVTTKVKKNLEEQLPDYHVLCITKDNYKDFKFECVNPADSIDQVDIEQLYRLITEDDNAAYEHLQGAGLK